MPHILSWAFAPNFAYWGPIAIMAIHLGRVIGVDNMRHFGDLSTIVPRNPWPDNVVNWGWGIGCWSICDVGTIWCDLLIHYQLCHDPRLNLTRCSKSQAIHFSKEKRKKHLSGLAHCCRLPSHMNAIITVQKESAWRTLLWGPDYTGRPNIGATEKVTIIFVKLKAPPLRLLRQDNS